MYETYHFSEGRRGDSAKKNECNVFSKLCTTFEGHNFITRSKKQVNNYKKNTGCEKFGFSWWEYFFCLHVSRPKK
jgi:hypothetical protein